MLGKFKKKLKVKKNKIAKRWKYEMDYREELG